MPEQNKDRLEDFFRKGAQDYHFEYNESDWKKLAKKLDKVDRGGVVPFYRTNGFKAVVLILGIAGLTYLLWPSDNDTNQLTKDNNSISSEQRDSDGHLPTQSEENTSSNLDIAESGPVNSASVAEPTEGNRNVSGNKLNAESNQPDQPITNNRSSSDQGNKSSAQGNTEGSESGMNNVSSALTESGKRLSNNGGLSINDESEDANFQKSVVSGEGRSNRARISRMAPIGISFVNEYNYSGIEITAPEREKENEELIEEKDEWPTPKLSVAFTYSPDYSSVGMGNFSETGSRYGGFITYSFSQGISLRTGAVKIKNYYATSGYDYYANYDWFTNGVMPTRASGVCEILEIPVSLQYNFIPQGRHNVFVSGGLSSYIMLDERYDFEYAYPVPGSKPYWKSSEVSQHIFGVLNFSVGYEYRLARRWSVQAEPFINIPISGIGWGEVNLYSIGSYFSLKYVLYHKY